MPKKTCQKCAYFDNNKCKMLNGITVQSTDNNCPLYTDEIKQCNICGNILVGKNYFITLSEKSQQYIAVCPQCNSQSGTCATCEHRDECDFQTNPSTLPKAVMKTFQQGPMTMQQQVMNPERIRETCEKGCPCFSQEFGCLKQNGTCGNYKGVI